MILGLRGVVLLDRAEADLLAAALRDCRDTLAADGADMPATLSKACNRIEKACRDASAGVPDVSSQADQTDSVHADLRDFVDTKQAASIIGCSPANVRDLARRGTLSGRRVSGRWFYPKDAVVAYSGGPIEAFRAWQ